MEMLQAAAPAGAVAEQGAPSREAGPAVAAPVDVPAQAGFSPFAGIGVVRPPPPPMPLQPLGGDLTPTMVAMVLAFAAIGWLIRKLVP